ncbi:MAG: MBL fold metallo-hydrolase [Longimonas sp.]|uniref:MBL fold metallo-hydrolase n=1 Tax=Longimonas sp. TaxID=2039626 RepID=UPI003350E88C
MEFVALGDTDDIAASCHYLGINGTGLLLDAGVDPRKEGKESLPNFDLVHNAADRFVDHAFVTHAHHDHMGAVPVLYREFPHIMTHMTDATRRLLEFLLPASARLQRRRVREGSTQADPLFTEDEVDPLGHLYLTHDLQKPFKVTGLKGNTEITARFYTAGHILGGVGVELTIGDGDDAKRVFYTSDTKLTAQSILPGANYPDTADVLILESTAGNDPEAAETSRPEELEKFTATLQETLERGGTALIPVFVMGRAQETLAVIDRLKHEGKIDDDVPVYTAGSMRAIADLYDQTRTSTPRVDSDFRVFGVDQKRLPRSEKRKAKALEGPAIHVLSSGMMFEPTLSNLIGRRLVEDEKNAILMVGYSKEGSPAARLLEAAEQGNGTEVVLNPDHGPQSVRCTVDDFRFSGHSNRDELLEVVKRMAPREVILVHGEPDARAWMAEHITQIDDTITVHQPEGGVPVELDL